MRPERAPRASWLLASTSAAALVATVTPAWAVCYNSIATPSGVFALSGDVCTADPGTYNPTIPPDVALPVPYTGFGFFATNQAVGEDGPITGPGGVINSPGAVTINTTGEGNAYGAWSQGTGSQINFAGPTTISTTGTSSFGLYASGGGAIDATAPVTVTTDSGGVLAYSGGAVTLNGGSITTTGEFSQGVAVLNGGSASVTGTVVTTSGDASSGLLINGAGGTLIANNVRVTTSGSIIPAGDTSDGAYNGPGGGYAAGGDLSITNSTILTEGHSATGVATSTSGVTTISGGSVETTGLDSIGIHSEGGGDTTVMGTSVVATGDGAKGLFIDGTGSSLSASNLTVTTQGSTDTADGSHAEAVFNGSGNFTGGGTATLTNLTIKTSGDGSNGVVTEDGGTTTLSGGSVNTTGNAAYAVSTNSGGLVSLNATTIGTTGNGSGGLGINGGEIDATGVSITTTGGFDSVSGQHSYGVYNGPFESFTSGGVAKLTDTSISTQGVEMFGVLTNTGGATTILGGSITTAGRQANAVQSENGGAVTVGLSASSTPATAITTTGTSAVGVVAYNGGAVQLTGATIATSGAGSTGLAVNGAGSSITAAGVSVTTLGGIDPATGDHAVGAFNGPYLPGGLTSGGTLSLTHSAISTSGAGANGVVTTGGVTNISGGSVSTSGQDAHALFVTGSGSQASLSGAGTFATTGAGAIGLYAALGGVISATSSTMTTVTTSGGVSPATGLGAYGVNADGAGSSIKLGSVLITTSGAGATGLFAGDRASSGAAGTITATGTLNVHTKDPSAAAVALQGNGAAITATGGGTITAAGNAIAFMGGTGQTATFDNFVIGNLSGDLVFADPSTATVNFNATTANAGNNNLLNATGGSAITLNASASMLTGAIRTDAASTSNVNLMNSTTWTLTAPSTVTSLNVTHSIIVFAPPGSGGAFKTLTVTNYAGNGANIAMNVALGGSGSSVDQIIINGGKATGSTLLTVNNVGGLGGQTSGNGIPLVLTKNGGSISSNAFTLANTPMAGGFKYTLEETDNSFFLVSSPTATVGGITNSINNVAKAQQSQMITNRVLGSLLVGATQQVSCSSCGGGFASFGSFALGGQGRWSPSDNTTLIGGVSYNQYSASGITVYDAPTAAAALIYDFVNWGSSRPFFEVGAGLTPYEQVNTTRTYPNGNTTGFGYSTAIDRNAALFGRAGWVDRLTPIDEAAAYVDLGRSWMQTGGYSEQMTSINPFPATVPNGLASLNVARLGAQYTHLFNGNIEVNVGAAVAYGFGAGAGAQFNVFQFGTIAPGAIADSAWFEYSGRVGYRFTDRLVVDAFLLGTAGGLAGNFVHGGVGVRYSF